MTANSKTQVPPTHKSKSIRHVKSKIQVPTKKICNINWLRHYLSHYWKQEKQTCRFCTSYLHKYKNKITSYMSVVLTFHLFSYFLIMVHPVLLQKKNNDFSIFYSSIRHSAKSVMVWICVKYYSSICIYKN